MARAVSEEGGSEDGLISGEEEKTAHVAGGDGSRRDSSKDPDESWEVQQRAMNESAWERKDGGKKKSALCRTWNCMELCEGRTRAE